MSLLDLYVNKQPRNVIAIDPSHEELKQEKVVDEKGVVSKITSYVKTSVEDKNKQFRSSDFMIESLDIVGKLKDLREVKMSNNDAGSFASSVEQLNSVFEQQIAKHNEQPSQETPSEK